MKRLLTGAFGGFMLAGVGLVALDRLCPPDLSRLHNVGREIDDRDGRVVAFVPAKGGIWRLPASADAVPPFFRKLLVGVEDRRFYNHFGVDPLAVARAAWQLARTGRVVSGASTLTMQVARLLEPRPRTLRSKIVEAFRAVQLEERFSKREILGMWLTLAPFGGNLEGVRAASWAWFGHGPAGLSLPEAALLAALPRRPEALRPDRHPRAAEAARAKVLRVAAWLGLPDADGARQLPIPRARLPLPRAAPQLVAGLVRTGGAQTIGTTIDLPLQLALERLATERLRRLPERASLALIVADANTRQIRALVGGAPWGVPNRAQRGASLDLTRAVRSPGSALKPFIYAMAFADGFAGPETVLPDLPEHFSGYSPEDFSQTFSGPVIAADALRRSLNLPAVNLLRRVGPLRFMAVLEAAGGHLKLPFGAAASLPLALGGAGISLREMVGLYAALAAGGSSARLIVAPDEKPARQPFLEPQAARSVADILTRPLPDGGPGGIAWKTGTSWGGRDAWALGFDARHVVGVWVGRPDGTAMPGGTGGTLALPILAQVFAMLPPAPRAVMPATKPAPKRIETAKTGGLRLLFPPPGAVLRLEGSVPIRAMGGRRPLSFMVDGAPLASDRVRRNASWTPPGPGFYRLTVIDAEGETANARVRVE